jgi:hypothetical protein
MGESGTGERETGLTVPFLKFLHPAHARTGPLMGPSLPQNGPERMREAGLYGTDLPVRFFFQTSNNK